MTKLQIEGNIKENSEGNKKEGKGVMERFRDRTEAAGTGLYRS